MRGPRDITRPKEDFDSVIIDLARVTRVQSGGKRMRFRACVAIGDKRGRVGIGTAKGADVSTAISKGTTQAKKHLIEVPIVNNTIPHDVMSKFHAARVILKPAKQGRGVIAGGAVRTIVELTGIGNIVSKMLGSQNKINNAHATIKALSSLKLTREARHPERSPSKLEERRRGVEGTPTI